VSKWKKVKIGILADSISETHSFNKKELIFLNTSDIYEGKVLNTSYSQISAYPGQAKKSIKKDDILLSEIRPANKRFAFINFQADDYVVSTKLMVIRSNGEVLPKYLYYFLTSREISQWLQHLAESRSGTFPQITFDQVADLDLNLPAKDVQEKIVSIVENIDEKIELNRRMNETLEAISRAIFKSWFLDFDPVIDNALRARNPIPSALGEKSARRHELLSRASAEGRNFGLPQPLAVLFPDRFVDFELGEIPKGWRVGTLSDVAEHLRRGVRPDELDISTPYIALEHMPKRCIALAEWSMAGGLESNKFEFKRGEILFGKLRPYFHKVGVAPLDGVCSTDIVVVTPRAERWFGFVLAHMTSDAFVEYSDTGSTGTKMPRTSWGEMARYTFVIPPEAVAEAFTKRVRQSVDRIIASIFECRTLAVLRDTLLPKLISGELRVKEAELLSGPNMRMKGV